MTDPYPITCDVIRHEIGSKLLDLTSTVELVDIPGWDSVTMAAVLMELEERFSISVNRRRIEHIVTVGDLVALIETRS